MGKWYASTFASCVLAFLLTASVNAGEAPKIIKDPTRPLGGVQATSIVEDKQPEDFALQGIYWRNQQYVAVINGQIVRQGSVLNGIEITRVDKNRVAFRGAREGEMVLFPSVLQSTGKRAK